MRDHRRAGAVAGAVVAGTFLLWGAGAGRASADTPAGQPDPSGVLRTLLDDIIGGSGSTPSPAPTGGAPAASPGAGKKPASHAGAGGGSHQGHSGAGSRDAAHRAAAHGGTSFHFTPEARQSAPQFHFTPLPQPVPPSPGGAQPLLPSIASPGPAIRPSTAPVRQTRTRDVAAVEPADAEIPLFLVAGAAGIAGAVAALDISMLRRRRRAPGR